MKWEPVVTVRLPYPVSENRYFRDRIVTPKGKPAFIQRYVSPEAREYQKQVRLAAARGGRARGDQGARARRHPAASALPAGLADARSASSAVHWDDTVQRIDLSNARKVLNDALNEVAIVDDFWIWEDSGKVMEPRQDVEACVVVRICRGIKDNPQAALDLPEARQPLKEVAFP
jgi:crossover junction endodeoxyribonuclease RusA